MKSRDDYEDFLIYERFKFYPEEGNDEALRACARAAYRDLQRTVHGISKHPKASQIKTSAEKTVLSFLRRVKAKQTDREFNECHREHIEALINNFKKEDFDQFTCGQAQKWLNMALKYVFVMGEKRVGPGFEKIYSLCHVPVDAYLLKVLPKAFQNIIPTWSKLVDYEAYVRFQEMFREHFPDQAPLDAEFDLWMRSAREMRKSI